MSSLKKPPFVALDRPKFVAGPALPRVVPVTGRVVTVCVTAPPAPVVTVVVGVVVVVVPLEVELMPLSRLVSGELPTLNA